LSTVSVTQTNKDQLIPEKDDNVWIKRNAPDIKIDEGPATDLEALFEQSKLAKNKDNDDSVKSEITQSGSGVEKYSNSSAVLREKEKQKELEKEIHLRKDTSKEEREIVNQSSLEIEKIGNKEIEKEKERERKGKSQVEKKEAKEEEEKERKEKEENKENHKDKKEKSKADPSVVGKMEKRGSSSSLMAQTKSSWRKSLGFSGFSSKHKDKKDNRQGSTPFASTLRSSDQPVKRSEKILFRDKKSKVSTEERKSKSKSLGDLDARLKPLKEVLILDPSVPPSHVVSTADIPRELSSDHQTQAKKDVLTGPRPTLSPLNDDALLQETSSPPPFTDRRSPIGKDRGKTSF
jgi:hypothetical protein